MTAVESEACCSSFPFEKLPAELQVLVAKSLHHKELGRLCCASRSVLHTLEEEGLWTSLLMARFGGLLEGCLATWGRVNATRVLWQSNPRLAYCHISNKKKFTGQVFNREIDNAAEDFTFSAYDATLHYEGDCPDTDAPLFTASYLPMGRERVMEQRVPLGRIRATPQGIHPHRVKRWCVSAVQEGEEVEVQWRGEKTHPFGWWFGVVHQTNPSSVMIEFPQYPQGSPWRSVVVPVSKEAAGDGGVVNADLRWGFLGGLRVLSEPERARWREQRALVAAAAAVVAAQQQQEGGAAGEGQEAEHDGEAGEGGAGEDAQEQQGVLVELAE